MSKYRRSEVMTACVLLAPFVIVYAVLFVYPTLKMVAMTFTKAPLIGEGEWVGLKNYARLFKDKLFFIAVTNTFYFVALTVIPSTLLCGMATPLPKPVVPIFSRAARQCWTASAGRPRRCAAIVPSCCSSARLVFADTPMRIDSRSRKSVSCMKHTLIRARGANIPRDSGS